MKVRILSRKAKPFKGTDGDEVMYFWYDAVREEDGVHFQFGSVRDHEPAESCDLEIQKSESKSGRVFYKEVA